MIWYIKNWNKFTADNKRSFILGVMCFIYAGYLLFVLIFPQYLNIKYFKILTLFMLPVIVYGGHLITKNFKNIEKIEKRTRELDEKNQTLTQLTADMDQIKVDMVSNIKNIENGKDTEKTNEKLETLAKQFNAKNQEALNLVEDFR